jgi:hypothetical protein
LILCALMNLTISAPFINLSICMLLRILHIYLKVTVRNSKCELRMNCRQISRL